MTDVEVTTVVGVTLEVRYTVEVTPVVRVRVTFAVEVKVTCFVDVEMSFVREAMSLIGVSFLGELMFAKACQWGTFSS